MNTDKRGGLYVTNYCTLDRPIRLLGHVSDLLEPRPFMKSVPSKDKEGATIKRTEKGT